MFYKRGIWQVEQAERVQREKPPESRERESVSAGIPPPEKRRQEERGERQRETSSFLLPRNSPLSERMSSRRGERAGRQRGRHSVPVLAEPAEKLQSGRDVAKARALARQERSPARLYAYTARYAKISASMLRGAARCCALRYVVARY